MNRHVFSLYWNISPMGVKLISYEHISILMNWLTISFAGALFPVHLLVVLVACCCPTLSLFYKLYFCDIFRLTMVMGRAITQAASGWLPPAAARV
jgi:hypothetical protein